MVYVYRYVKQCNNDMGYGCIIWHKLKLNSWHDKKNNGQGEVGEKSGNFILGQKSGNKRIPCCHSSGQSCPGKSDPIPRRAWEWDLTSRYNSVPKKWQRGILFLTRNYQTIAKN